LVLRTGFFTRSATSAAGVLDSKEEAFLQRALQPDVALRPSAAQLLDADPYIRLGPECVATAARREREMSRGWVCLHEILEGDM
jgi:hypothetical protein